MTATHDNEERTEDARPRDQRLVEAWEAVRSDRTQAVSTDVFDTLVWRQVPEPVDAFPLVAERLRERAALADDLTPDAFGRLRQAAEIEARERKRPRGHVEVTLGEIYDLLPAWVFGHQVPSAEATSVELEVERQLIVPDLEIVDLLEAAQRHGKLLLATSDTYFSATELQRFFAQPVLERLRFDHIFTSSDHRIGKSGGLYAIVLRRLGLDADQLVHIGDSAEADVRVPSELGVRCFSFPQRSAALARVMRAEQGFVPAHRATTVGDATLMSGLTATRAKVLSRVERADVPESLRPFWDYGAAILGPVFTGFAEWVWERAQRAGARKVLCLMREGALLADLLTAASAYMNAKPGAEVEAVPFWVNRSLCLRAAIAAVDRPEIDKILSRRSPPTVTDLLQALGLQFADVTGWVGHAETPLDDPVTRANLIEHLGSEPAVRARVLANAEALRERIVAYTERAIGDDDGNVMVVDLGWGATIQAELAGVLRQAGRPRTFIGLYLLTNARATQQVLGGAEARGFLGEFGEPGPASELLLRSPELLEQICMPPLGSQRDLTDDLEPVLDPLTIPELQQVEADAVRKGILAYQREWSRYQIALRGRLGTLGDAQRLLRPILLRAIAAPTGEEAALFGRWHHDENQGSARTETVADPAALPRLRYMTPDQARKLPMTELYWPFGLAGLVDEHWPAMMRAAAAGDIAWEALGAPVDTGEFSVEPTKGVHIGDHTRHSAVPARNRQGLSMVTGTLNAPHIGELTVRPSDRPAVLRIDWFELRCWTQGRAEPVCVRLEGPGLGVLRNQNCFHLNPDVFIAHGDLPVLTLDLAAITPGVVFRIDYEIAFAAFAISPVLPAGGRFPTLEHAAKHIERIEGSATWRMTAPLRKLRGRLG